MQITGAVDCQANQRNQRRLRPEDRLAFLAEDLLAFAAPRRPFFAAERLPAAADFPAAFLAAGRFAFFADDAFFLTAGRRLRPAVCRRDGVEAGC
jgi:hypothetical protein